MFKTLTSALVLVSLATPAFGRDYQAYTLGERQATATPVQTYQVDVQATPGQLRIEARPAEAVIVPTQSSYREGHTREQLTFALAQRTQAARMCRAEADALERQLNKRAFERQLTNTVVDIGGQVVGGLLNRELNPGYNFPVFIRGHQYSSYGEYRRDNPGQDCNDFAEEVYQDALQAQPDSYCDESMTAAYTRGGQPVTREEMVRRCQARTVSTSWNQGFQPRN